MGLELIIILTLASLLGFYMAWNIGANDVANAMGTSVGSGSLTLKQAIWVAAILEFCGAFFVGGHVTDTVRKGMLDLSQIPDPQMLMLGMIGSLAAAGVWLNFATYMRWPASTTQSIVGAIVGFGLVIAGVGAIKWTRINSIVASWFISPILAATISILLFALIRKFIFNSPRPLRATLRIAPVLTFLVFVVITLVTTFKGLKNLHLDLNFMDSLLVSIVVSLIPALLSRHMIAKAIAKLRDEKAKLLLEKAAAEEAGKKVDETILTENYYFPFIEKVFKYLQILSACSVAFAHGANDVANAIGPIAAVWEIAIKGEIVEKVAVNPIIPALGGLGIVIGLATWGWRIIETIGKKITDLTPSRGFSAEFGAATTILLASRMGLPVSTTHCLVGAVVGVALARGLVSLNLKMLRTIFLSWVLAIPATAILSIIFYFILSAIFL